MAQPSTWTFVAEGETAKELPLVDLTLWGGADDCTIRIHRGLLLTLSTKFAATTLATSGKELTLPGKTGAEVTLLVGWMYHRLRIEEFTLDIAKKLVIMASEYEIPALLKDVDAWLCREVQADHLVKPFLPVSTTMKPYDYVRLWPTAFPGTESSGILSTCVKGHSAASYGQGMGRFTIGNEGTYTCCGCGSAPQKFVDRLSAAQKAALEAAFASEAKQPLNENKSTAAKFSELLLLARTYKLTGLTRLLCGMMEHLAPSHAQLVLLAYVLGDLKATCSVAA